MNITYRDFARAGHVVFPLHPINSDRSCGCNAPDCTSSGKHPMPAGWNNLPPLTPSELADPENPDRFKCGYKCGYGVRCDNLLVIDVDARNGGIASYERLLEKVPEVAEAGLVVNTGSGGGSKHLYFSRPPDLKLSGKLAEYSGLDFKSSGFVVGPGSPHKSGEEYVVASGGVENISDAPDGLVALLKRREPEYDPRPSPGEIDGKKVVEIQALLDRIDPDCAYDDWMTVGMCIHHETQGCGLDLWDTWSKKGEKYKGRSDLEKHWRSFGQNSGKPVTLGTLRHLANCGTKGKAKAKALNGVIATAEPDGRGPAQNASAFVPEGASRDCGELKQADQLIELAAAAQLFHTPDGIGYADIKIDGHRETWRIEGKTFSGWLKRRFFETTGGAANSEAMKTAHDLINTKAAFEGPERDVCLRVGTLDCRVYLDLCDAAWRVVEIDANGWRLVDTAPVRFRRTTGMSPLPAPEKGGTIADLRPFLNVASDGDFVLAVSWLLAAFRTGEPYPLLVLSGEQGSAKSTFSRLMRALVDPNQAPLRSLPREERDMFVAANNAHVLAFDNVSTIAHWLSDTLCRLATGGGFALRQLYTDQDEVLFQATRPIILNGIEDVAEKPDLADRALLLTLLPIREDQRRPERDLLAEFEAQRPRILGALLDAVANGLANLPTTNLDRHPRMADFARWATACEPALGQPGTFMAAYMGNRADAVESVVDGDPVAAAVRSFMLERSIWEGTATELLSALASMTDQRTVKEKSWPSNPRALAGRLRRVATVLRTCGIEIHHNRTGRWRARIISITKSALVAVPDLGSNTPSASSVPSAHDNAPMEYGASGDIGMRTMQGPADDGTNPEQPIVRVNLPDFGPADGADDADAKLPAKSGSEGAAGNSDLALAGARGSVSPDGSVRSSEFRI